MTGLTATLNDSKVLVIGWDAADWRVIRPLLAEGKMPNLKKMMDEGVHGNISTLNPVLSPMLWSSIATGKRPYKHGIHGFSEPTPDGKGLRPITNVSRKSKAIWNMLNQVGKKCNVVGWWPSHPAEPIDGVMVSNWYQTARNIKNGELDPEIGKPRPGVHGWKGDQWDMAPGTIHPERLSKSLQEFRFHPLELDPEHVGPFIPKFMEIDQRKDERLSGFAKILADTVSIHGAATALMQLEPWDFMAVYYDGIDHFGHGFMKYHPPRQEWVQEEDFELYKGVVEGGYLFHDMMLGAKLQLAGPDTTVILLSDHGFHPDHLRPEHIPAEPAGPAIEHRPYGIFVARGKGIKAGEVVQGASVLDLTPTVLACFGLPTGEDMDGKPLVTIFDQPPSIETVPSWDEIDGPNPDGMHPPDALLDSVQSAEAMKQLVELGYIEEINDDTSVAVRETVRELDYNLAQAYMDGGKLADATVLLESIWNEWSYEHRFGLNYIACLNGMQRHEEAKEAIKQFAKNVVESAKWAANRLEELRDEAAEYGVDLPRPKPKPKPGVDDGPIEAVDTESAAAEDEGEKPESRPQDLPKKLLFEIRKVISLLQPMGTVITWMAIKNQIALGDTEQALPSVLRMTEELTDHPHPDMHNQVGMALVDLDQPETAKVCFDRALAADDENAVARHGLAKVALRLEQWDETVDHSLATIELRFHNPQAHHLLAQALQQLGDSENARIAYGVAVQQAPSLMEARDHLVALLDELGETEEADLHRRIMEQSRESREFDMAIVDNDIDKVAEGIREARNVRRVKVFAEVGGKHKDAETGENDAVTVVSGLPRSGTSMMMQMLAKAGLQPYTDDRRKPDSDNPRGYLEHEMATRIASEQDWVSDVRGGVVKIVAQLLDHLPPGERYRVVFMDRDLREVVKSQRDMLDRLEKEGGRLSEGRMMQTLDAQVARVEIMLAAREDIEILFVAYDEVIEDPKREATRVAEFIGGSLDIDAMVEAVDGALRRHRFEE